MFQNSSSTEQFTKSKCGKYYDIFYHNVISINRIIKTVLLDFYHYQIDFYYYSENNERLAKFGKSLSVTSRQYRAKRIAVNVKVNGLGYLAEMLGGILSSALMFFKDAHIMYVFMLIWFGNVIPACYLINFDDNKKSIIEDGWISTFSKVFRNKDKKVHI